MPLLGQAHQRTRLPRTPDPYRVSDEHESDTKRMRELNAKLTANGRCPRCHLLLPHADCLPASAAELPLHRGVDMDGP